MRYFLFFITFLFTQTAFAHQERDPLVYKISMYGCKMIALRDDIEWVYRNKFGELMAFRKTKKPDVTPDYEYSRWVPWVFLIETNPNVPAMKEPMRLVPMTAARLQHCITNNVARPVQKKVTTGVIRIENNQVIENTTGLKIVVDPK